MAEKMQFLTAEGKKKLIGELDYLRTVRRQQVADALKSAVDEGDLTENAGYEESKREQAFLEGRIRDLEGILSDAQVLISNSVTGIVSLGARVTVAEDGLDPETYLIVGRAEADPLLGRISNESPLGRALLGRRMGEKVMVGTPGGAVQFEIISVQ